MKKYRYIIEFGLSMAVYSLLLVLSNWLVRRFDPDGLALVLVTLMPVLAVGLITWAVLREMARLDELQRRIQLDALAFSFAGTAVLTVSWAFAEKAGLSRLPTFAVWPFMGSLWIIGVCIGRRRYR